MLVSEMMMIFKIQMLMVTYIDYYNSNSRQKDNPNNIEALIQNREYINTSRNNSNQNHTSQNYSNNVKQINHENNNIYENNQKQCCLNNCGINKDINNTKTM